MASDEIDTKLRKKLAWATSIDEREDEPTDKQDDAALEAERARARAYVEELAKDVEAAWVLRGDEQERAARRLAKRIDKHGLHIAAMPSGAHAVRLVRLLVRHREALDKKSWANARAMLGFLSLDPDEVDDLVVEIVRGNAWDLTVTMSFALGEHFAPSVRLQSSLTAMLDDTDLGYERRALAAHFLVGDVKQKSAATLDALRRALRAPHLELRWKALYSLGSAVDDESIVFLLEDAVIHPIVHEDWETPDHYCERLQALIRDKHPAAAIEPLERIVDGDAANAGVRTWLDDDWALATLAAGYPERAVPIIDDWSHSGNAYTRIWAARAAAHLPRADALTRLRCALGDASLAVSRDAQRLFDHLDEHVSLPTLPTCFEGLVTPSEKLLSRILAARTVENLDAFKEKIAPTLLAEAPDPEAVILYLMLFDSHTFKSDLTMFTSFGEIADRAVCRIIEAYPNGQVDGWPYAIQNLTRTWEEDEENEEKAQKRDLLKRLTPELRTAIARVMSSPTWDRAGCLSLLHTIRADARHIESLFSLATSGDSQVPFDVAYALKTIESNELSERILDALREAWRTHDADAFTRLLTMRSDETCLALAEEVVATFAPEDMAIGRACARLLERMERIDARWVLEHLAWGDRFVEIAASFVHFSSVTEEVIARLRQLFRTAPDAHSKLVVIKALVWARARIPKKDLDTTLDSVDVETSANLLELATLLGASPKSFAAKHFERIFTDASEETALAMVERLGSSDRKSARGARALLKNALTQSKSDRVRAAITSALGLSKDETYWVA